MNKRGTDRGKGKPHSSPAGEMVVFPLSSDVWNIIEKNQTSCQNIGLLLSKYVKWNVNWLATNLEAEFERLRKSKAQLLDKKTVYNPAVTVASNSASEASSHLRNYFERFKATLSSLEKSGWKVERLSNVKTQWRMVVGLGSGSILETSMTFHRIYGFPIIPGSGLKGLAKAYANTVENIPDSDQQITDVFGSQSSEKPSQGKVIFFDAIPVKFPKLKLDIMNPHYQDYYSDPSGKTPPADYLSPNPIFFLTVGEGAEFYFAVASKEEHLAKLAKGWLENALKELGVGAKTSAGYGYFE
ncbi:MAG TPA: type III-B CRISPR module RAMP protein Cmr6 [Thermodesulfobacteriota bacterium]|nr:type III-B CRISPR module RAMP protein Cmr6 [Thermodesulfobacteriota bacterium]